MSEIDRAPLSPNGRASNARRARRSPGPRRAILPRQNAISSCRHLAAAQDFFIFPCRCASSVDFMNYVCDRDRARPYMTSRPAAVSSSHPRHGWRERPRPGGIAIPAPITPATEVSAAIRKRRERVTSRRRCGATLFAGARTEVLILKWSRRMPRFDEFHAGSRILDRGDFDSLEFRDNNCAVP